MKAIYDKQNPYSSFILNLYPLRKAKISSFIDPIAPLARLTVDEIRSGHDYLEADLHPDELVLF